MSLTRNATGEPWRAALTVMLMGPIDETSGFNAGIALKWDDVVEIAAVRHATSWQFTLDRPCPVPARTMTGVATRIASIPPAASHLRIGHLPSRVDVRSYAWALGLAKAPESLAVRFFPGPLVLLDDLLRDVRGDLLVVRELHGE